MNRQEEARGCGDPSGAVERETTAWHHAVNMGMMLEVLTPRVQDAEQSDVGSQVLGVASNLKERRGTGAEEQVVEQPLVLQYQGRQLMGQREDDVEVGHGQQLGGARGQPSGACVALALGTVPVATRVIGDGLMSAAGASIAMTSERRRAATDDGVHHLAVLGGEMRSMPLEKAAAGATQNVGHLKGGPGHPFTRLLECFTSFVVTASASSGLATACRCRLDKCR